MGKALVSTGAAVAALVIGACGGDTTTTVINNTTTVSTEATTPPAPATTPPSPPTESRNCGEIKGRQANFYDIEAAATKCEHARNLAELWPTTCLNGPAECAIGDYACVSTEAGNASFSVTCRATVENGTVRFVVFPS